MASGANFENVTCEHRQQHHEGDDEQRREDYDQETRANGLISPAELPPFDDALPQRFLASRITTRSHRWLLAGTQLHGPNCRQKIKNRLSRIRSGGAKDGNEKAR